MHSRASFLGVLVQWTLHRLPRLIDSSIWRWYPGWVVAIVHNDLWQALELLLDSLFRRLATQAVTKNTLGDFWLQFQVDRTLELSWEPFPSLLDWLLNMVEEFLLSFPMAPIVDRRCLLHQLKRKRLFEIFAWSWRFLTADKDARKAIGNPGLK